MPTRVAINGLGRIGRATLKILIDEPQLELAAVNDIAPAANLAYLLKYDSVYGRYHRPVEARDGTIVVDGRECRVLEERDPQSLPWKDLGIVLVFECTGRFTHARDLEKHRVAGAKRVILSAPAKSDDIPTVVHGANIPDAEASVISCASCTTNCITPVVEIMVRRIGVRKAAMSTVHAYTSTQALVDTPASKMRRGRAGAVNIVPTSTGAATATAKALPELSGRFDGMAMRVPVPTGSIADITFVSARETTREEVNDIFREEAASNRYRGIVAASDEPIVSSDIVGDSHASIVDLLSTQVVDGDLVKVCSWYDNEWGYASQMVREAVRMSAAA